MATRYSISEQVKLKLNGGYPDISSSTRIEDIMLAVNQKINQLYKVEQFNVTFPSGETIPNNLTMMTYEDVPVTSNKKSRAESILPVMPVSLPRNMGVFDIISEDDSSQCDMFIPIPAGQYQLLAGQPLISDLLGHVGYEVYGNRVVYTKDIYSQGVKKVTMKLIVMDINSLDDYSPLPLSADMESTVIDEVYKSFLPVQPEVRVSDNYQSTQIPKQ